MPVGSVIVCTPAPPARPCRRASPAGPRRAASRCSSAACLQESLDHRRVQRPASRLAGTSAGPRRHGEERLVGLQQHRERQLTQQPEPDRLPDCSACSSSNSSSSWSARHRRYSSPSARRGRRSPTRSPRRGAANRRRAPVGSSTSCHRVEGSIEFLGASSTRCGARRDLGHGRAPVASPTLRPRRARRARRSRVACGPCSRRCPAILRRVGDVLPGTARCPCRRRAGSRPSSNQRQASPRLRVQPPAVPPPDGTGRRPDLAEVLGQRQVGVGSQFAHRNTTTSEPHCQAPAVSAGKGRPRISSQ